MIMLKIWLKKLKKNWIRNVRLFFIFSNISYASSQYIDLSKPLLKDLHNIVVPKVANKWYGLGIQLLDQKQLPKLDGIRTTYSNDQEGGCVEMLKYWLDVTPEATWDNLLCALRAPGLQLLSIAVDLEEEVKG